MDSDPLYDPANVRRLFDEMAQTYHLVNVVSSFGFAVRWRRQCLHRVPLAPGSHVVDLMSGMGELATEAARKLGPQGSIRAIDLSPAMCRRARQTADRLVCPTTILEADALNSGLPDDSACAVISAFGVKTFSPSQLRRLACEIHRILKPGGVFTLVEISVPLNPVLRWLYMMYLKRLIPPIGWLFMGNPDNYRMLGVYTERFGRCDSFCTLLNEAGLETKPESYFFGCATGVSGRKPGSPSDSPTH